jgi:hypothetical protein
VQAPQAPNPYQTAQAQSGFNKESATAQAGLNMVSQTGPLSSTTYNEAGKWSDGTQRFEQTTSFNPQIQSLLDSNISKVGQPFNVNNEATESRLMELGRMRLDPALDRRRESTEQSLFNRGVRPGTEAYRRGMEAVTQGENDAYNQLALTGRSQAVNEALTERNQPLNEFLALMSGGQIQTPQLQGSGVAPVDYSGLVNSNYNQQNQQYQNTWNGIGNLAGAAGGWMFSDEDLKTDIVDTGIDTPDGIDVKAYRYVGSPMMQLGVIAQEAEKVRPDAVRMHPSGFRQVHYPSLMEAH